MRVVYDPFTVRRWPPLLVIAVVFALMYAVSWQKWVNVVNDSGREMNLPLRLLQGERLYADVYYLYGPLAPYVNAFLYGSFKVHLNTLYAAGTVSSLLLLLVTFRLGELLLIDRRSLTYAVLLVLVLCLFKQEAGSSIFPYTFSALYGALLGLAALLGQVRYVQSSRLPDLITSGAFTGLALISKLEFGLAALVSQVVVLLSAPARGRSRMAVTSLLAVLALPILTYGALSTRIPWDAMFRDTYLLPNWIPTELMYFNKLKLGWDDPWRTSRELFGAIGLLGSAAGLIGLASMRSGARCALPHQQELLGRWRRRLWVCTALSLSLLLVNSFFLGTRWDVSPLRALPLLCLGAIMSYGRGRKRTDQREIEPKILLLFAVYSLTVLARVATRVPTGGAHSALLLPAPLLLFTYLATTSYPRCFALLPKAEQKARRIVKTLLLLLLSAAIAVVSYRYQTGDYLTLQTARGSMYVQDSAFAQALDFLADETEPRDHILAIPEGSSLNFLASRPEPLRYQILTPGFLDGDAERQAIEQLKNKRVQFIFLLNRPTTEFGATVFGRDYYRELMDWIEANYELAVLFGEGVQADSTIGDPNFFIKCYKRRKLTR